MSSIKKHTEEFVMSVDSLDDVTTRTVREEVERRMGLATGLLAKVKLNFKVSEHIADVMEERERLEAVRIREERSKERPTILTVRKPNNASFRIARCPSACDAACE